jgi:hypothetical protein
MGTLTCPEYEKLPSWFFVTGTVAKPKASRLLLYGGIANLHLTITLAPFGTDALLMVTGCVTTTGHVYAMAAREGTAESIVHTRTQLKPSKKRIITSISTQNRPEVRVGWTRFLAQADRGLAPVRPG